MKKIVKLFALAAATAAFAAPVAHADVYASATWNRFHTNTSSSWNRVIGYGSSWSPMKSAPWASRNPWASRGSVGTNPWKDTPWKCTPMKSAKIGVNDAYRMFIGI